jgi:hypothetical protein
MPFPEPKIMHLSWNGVRTLHVQSLRHTARRRLGAADLRLERRRAIGQPIAADLLERLQGKAWARTTAQQRLQAGAIDARRPRAT